MLRENKERDFRQTLEYADRLSVRASREERDDYSKTYMDYLHARDEYFRLNTDKWLSLLVGYHARLNKLIREMDDKYGDRR